METTLTPDPNASSNLLGTNPNQDIINSLTTPQIDSPFSSSSVSTPSNLTASADNAVSSGAPVQNTTSSYTNQSTSVNRYTAVKQNPFDNYINVTYGISLAMVNSGSVQKISNEPVSRDINSSVDVPGMTSDDYIVFASTAETKTTKDRPEYYNIKGLVFTNFVAHMPQNPMVSSIWDAKIKLFEPHGFSLREDIENMRNVLGYAPELEPLNYVYRMEIWFSGWDPQTGNWVPRISFPLNDSAKISSIVYYLSITTIDAAVTPQGTEYQIALQIYSHKTFRAESIIFRQDVVPLGQLTAKNQENSASQPSGVAYGEAGSSTFLEFIDTLTKRLKAQILTDTKCGNFPGLDIDYRVVGPDWLMNATFDTKGKINIAHGTIGYSETSGMYSYMGQDTDILTILSAVMEAIPLVRNLLVRDDDHEFLYPAVMWNIRSNLKYTGDPRQDINGYNGYEYEYFIEPVLTYRSRTTDPQFRNMRVETKNQQQRVSNMTTFGMILREYDFYFTNDNTEVIDLEFRFKNYYQEPFPSKMDTIRNQSNQGDNANQQQESADNQAANTNSSAPTPSEYAITKPPGGPSLNTVLGQPVDPQSATSFLVTSAYKIQGMVRTGYPMQSKTVVNHEAQPDTTLYTYSKHQYYRYDMIDVNMTVRFDPTWLLNPYCATGDFTPRLPTNNSGNTNAVLLQHMDRVVLLRANAPVQSDFMNPNRTGGASQNIDALSGFFQVITAVNEFDGGKFVQKLNMFKYPHLNGFTIASDNTQPSTQNQSSLPVGPANAPSTQQSSGSLAPSPNGGGLM